MRELVGKGRVYFAIEKYAANEVSLGKAAEIAGVTISEMMDLLQKLGIESKMNIADYFEGKEVAERIV